MSGDAWFWFVAGMWASIGIRDLGEYIRSRRTPPAGVERADDGRGGDG